MNSKPQISSSSDMPPATPWKFLRVLFEPRRVFADVARVGQGFGYLWLFLALEFALLNPLAIATHIARISYDPLGGLLGVWSAYIHFALQPAIGVFVLGIILYYYLRRTPQRLDIWAAASVLAYAWVPHTLGVGLITIASSLGWTASGTLGRGLNAWLFLPSIVLVMIALWVCKKPIEPDRDVPPRFDWRLGSFAGVVTLIFALALASQVKHVLHQWDRVRPVMPEDAMPAFQISDLQGRTLRHTDLLGHVALIDFWATWCGPCVAAMPHLEALHRSFASRGVRLVSINTEPESRPLVTTFVQEHGLSFPVYVDDGRLQREFRVQNFPTLFLVDRLGKVREIHIGSVSMVTLKEQIEHLLDEES
ncbi:MAG: TlpA disulfide reductase family protein [Myxococcota bacterium]